MDGQKVILGLYRAAADPGTYEAVVDDWTASIEDERHWQAVESQLLPHLEVAADLVRETAEAPSERPVLVCDHSGQIVHCNEAGSAAGWATGGRAGDAAPLAIEPRQLRALFARMAAAGASSAYFHAGGGAGEPRWVVAVQRLATAGAARYQLRLSASPWDATRRACVAEALALTAREAQIVEALFDGESIKRLSARLAISEATARTHINAIYRKNGLSSQLQLTALVAQLIDLSRVPRPGPALPASWRAGPPPDGLVSQRLSDGAQLQFYRSGPRRSSALLYLHGNVIGYRFHPALDRALAARGVQLIAPIRPGYGASEAPPAGADWVAAGAARLVELVNALGLERVMLVGKDIGALFALRMAASLGARAQRVVSVATPVPQLRPTPGGGINKWGRAVIQSACLHPLALRYFMRAGFAFARRVGPERFFRAMF